MRSVLALVILCSMLGLFGCSKGDQGTSPPPPETEDWTFPYDTTYNMKIYSEKSLVSVGESFDVKVILYNVSNLVAVATEIAYSSDRVEVLAMMTGPLFVPDSTILTVKSIEPSRNLLSFGVTYRAGTNRSVTGSGVLVKMKCRGRAIGNGTFSVNPPPNLEIRAMNGMLANPPIRPAFNITIQ